MHDYFKIRTDLISGLYSHYECKGPPAQKIFSQGKVFESHSGQESSLNIYLTLEDKLSIVN